jgi:hypothetical protein
MYTQLFLGKSLLEDAVRKIKKESKYLTGKEILNANRHGVFSMLGFRFLCWFFIYISSKLHILGWSGTR